MCSIGVSGTDELPHTKDIHETLPDGTMYSVYYYELDEHANSRYCEKLASVENRTRPLPAFNGIKLYRLAALT